MGNDDERNNHPAYRESGLTTPEIFSSPEVFRKAFIIGLERLLDDKDSATQFCSFNIACANAYQDTEVLASVKPKLIKTHERFSQQLTGTEEDAEVSIFKHVTQVMESAGGWDNFDPLKTFESGDWLLASKRSHIPPFQKAPCCRSRYQNDYSARVSQFFCSRRHGKTAYLAR